ncbi:lipopolysaccharide biosynthesis protein [Cognatilysobacter segetis]|uniref:lipopolysaccharide biosynthesis protein n=1 Tax=Cognatilysobacter segetis TaxID=2492394 RepID=UPI00139034C2|nr:lipopolysaccharide biosynthesis protein [Lysobacter segetis]
MTNVAAFLAVAVVSAAGTAAARAYALRRRLVDEPGERRSHAVATPRGGGAGPVAALLLWFAVAQPAGAPTWWVAAALAGVALIGAWDDHASLPVSWRLIVHVLASLAVAAATVDVETRPWAFFAIAAGGVVLVNVWNFMDGIDGIATSQAVIAAIAIGLASPAAHDASFALAAACIAFLPFNFPRARIFLGDVGSGALGLAIGWIVATASVHAADAGDWLLPALPISAFLVDATLTLLRRMLRRERWWEPHTQHLYQGLARRYGHVRVTLAYAGWSILAALAALAVQPYGAAFTMGSVVLCYMGAALLWLVLQHQVAAERDASATRDP